MHMNEPHVKEISEAIAQGRLVPVVGAGVSMWTAHLPGWVDLVKKGLDYVTGLGTHSPQQLEAVRQLLKSGATGDTIEAAQRLKTFLRAPGGEYGRWLRQTFRVDFDHVVSHRLVLAIRRLHCPIIATTNYDRLLSDLHQPYLDAITWQNPSRMLNALDEGGAVLHLHGVYDEPESVVFGEDDYESVVQRAPAYRDVLRTLWLDRTLLFIGCSFEGIEDPDFINLLKWSAETFPGRTQKHYALFRRGSFTLEDVARFLHEWRIQIVSYGDTFDDLAPFIERLHRDQPRNRTPCPYPGMVALQSEDTELLFGRAAEIDKLIKDMKEQRLLAIVGPSGSGKSSLVCAGLLPALPSSSYWPNASWHKVPMRPGGKPIAALLNAVGASELGSATNGMHASVLAQMVSASMADQQPPANGHKTSASNHFQQLKLLVVDQFEEVFAQAAPAEQRRFIAVLEAFCALENH